MDTRGNGSGRPERVIILDADDPMVEVEGRIVWQEAHERIVEETRQQAFRAGYDAAVRETMAARTYRLNLRRRRAFAWWVRTVIVASLALFVLLYLLLLLQR